MSELQKVASYISEETGMSASVHRKSHGSHEVWTTTSDNADPNANLMSAIGIQRVTSETHVVTDPFSDVHIVPRAMLFDAVSREGSDVKTLVAAVFRRDEAKIEDYKRLGFADVGDTRHSDKSGRSLSVQAILLCRLDELRAGDELESRHIKKEDVTADGAAVASSGLPDKWRELL